MFKNNLDVSIVAPTLVGKIVERKFMGTGDNEEIMYLVEFASGDGEIGTRWFHEWQIAELKA